MSNSEAKGLLFGPQDDLPDPQFEGDSERPGIITADSCGSLLDSDPVDDGEGTWTPSMNFHQQVYLLSLFPNVIRTEVNTLTELDAIARQHVNMAGCWGPVFVAKKLTYDDDYIYAISVAGSPTIYNSVVNNAGIIPVVNFTTWATGAPPIPSQAIPSTIPYIALGTAMGVHTLESYPAPPGSEGAGQTLPVFLQNCPRGSTSQFIFTGFSLGGALSPTLALRLVKQDATVFTESDRILTYPIAGPSPGNVHFANAFAERFPRTIGTGYQVWNSNIANLLDVATNAWSTDSEESLRLDRIPRIYGNEPILGIEVKIALAIVTANKSGIVYIPLRSTLFTGPLLPIPTTEQQFVEIAALQHSIAYENYFGAKLPTSGDVFPELVIGII